MKKYVKVTATFDCDGDLIPEYIVWDDGRRYRIDKISDVRYAASLKAGGGGGNTLHRPYSRQRTIPVFGGKQVVCRCQTISGGLYA